MTINKIRKFVIIAIGIVIILAIILFFWSVLTRGKGSIVINTIPTGVQIVVDDKSYESPTKIKDISSGRHKIMIIKKGFKTREDDVLVRKNETTEITFRLYTADVTPTGLRVDLEVAQKQLSGFEKLSGFLPHNTSNYRIEYQMVSGNPSVVIILYARLNKASQLESFKKQLKEYSVEALDWISSKGVEPDNLNIIWRPRDPNGI